MNNRFVPLPFVVCVLASSGCTTEGSSSETISVDFRDAPDVDSTEFCQLYDDAVVRIRADDYGTYARALPDPDGTVVLDQGDGSATEYAWTIVCNLDDDDDFDHVQLSHRAPGGAERWMTVQELSGDNAVLRTTPMGTDELSVFQVEPGTDGAKYLIYGVSVFGNDGWEAIQADEQRKVLREVRCAPFLGLNFSFEPFGE